MVTAEPRNISTSADPKVAEKIRALVPVDGVWQHLGRRLVSSVLEAAQKLSAERVTLRVTSEGSTVLVGEKRTNSVEVPSSEIKAAASYELVLRTELLTPIFKLLSDFTQAQLLLTGPDSVVAVREGRYTFVLSPDRPEEKEK